jgi:hypothetical protein
MVRHLKEEHQWSRPKGRQSGTRQGASGLQTVVAFPVACQTFFCQSFYIRYFPVKLAPGTMDIEDQPGKPRHRLPTLSISEQIKVQLSEKLAPPNQAALSRPGPQHFSQVSPWLETTQ